MRKNILLFTLILLPALAFAAAPLTNEKPGVAVLNFKNLTPGRGSDFLEKTLAESLITSFQKSGRFQLTERQRLQELIDEKKLALTGLVEEDVKGGRSIGQLLRADYLVLGSYTSIGEQIEVNARLVQVDNGQVMLSERITEKMGDRLFSRISELGESMVMALSGEKAGTISIDSTPQGAEVRLNGDPIGNTPVNQRRQKPGQYSLSLTKEGYLIKNTEITVRPGQATSVNYNLEEKPEKFYASRVMFLLGVAQFLPGRDYAPSWNLGFEYAFGDFSMGIEGGGHGLFHYYTVDMPGTTDFQELQFLYLNKLYLTAKWNFMQDNKFISPYIGAGAGVYAALSEDFYTNTSSSGVGFYYKGMVGITLFPTGLFSLVLDASYSDMGVIQISEKEFNLFGNPGITIKEQILNNIYLNLGFRVAF